MADTLCDTLGGRWCYNTLVGVLGEDYIDSYKKCVFIELAYLPGMPDHYTTDTERNHHATALIPSFSVSC